MHDHLVRISDDHKLLIYRVFEDGRQDFYTSIDIPRTDTGFDDAVFSEFSQKLGESILFNSPSGRRAFSI